MTGIWIDGDLPPDTHAAFRGGFRLTEKCEVEIRTLGAGWFAVWLDGAWLLDGPERFERRHPQYRATRVTLAAGEHIMAAHAHHPGVETRLLKEMPAFFSCRVFAGNEEITLRWRGAKLAGYRAQVRRINPQLGWIEWCDTRDNPDGWQSPGFDDAGWSEPIGIDPSVGEPTEIDLGAMGNFPHPLTPMAEGRLTETFGYELDDPPARFFLRDFSERTALPPQGIWRRYDLGRVRLGRAEIELDAPPGAVVEIALAESLTAGRVAPFITLSTGLSCNMDHFIARGGRQVFAPLTPKGGRFLEVHVLTDDLTGARFHRETFHERGYHGEPEGAFRCSDERLDTLWTTCVETYRACAEDAVVDNPTRERGQWTGDIVVALETASAAFHDLRLCRRALVQAAQDARGDGMISSLPPVGQAFATTYALQWVNACVRYHELTGDAALLTELFPAALKNLCAFEPFVSDVGLSMKAGWNFVDWGYQARGEGGADTAQNIHYLQALRAMQAWCVRVDETGPLAGFAALEKRLVAAVNGATRNRERLDYHVAALALGANLLDDAHARKAVDYMKRHILSCFPNDPSAPRLHGPPCSERRLLTPYFAHFAFPPLIEHGETDFVLEQYRRCWGWMRDLGATTCLEVFDARWSHCHQWAACPAWQLSRYVLGLRPRFDLGENHFEFKPYPGSLERASGRVPLAGKRAAVDVSWEHHGGRLRCTLRCGEPLRVHYGAASPLEIHGEATLEIDV